jgi:molybdopterin converting factor small subunit
MITIKFYGKLRQLLGDEIKIEGKMESIEDLLQFLVEKNESIKKLKEHLIFSINQKQASLHDKIKDGDEISVFLPPTGG